MAAKKELKAPTKEEYKNLPKTKAEAIKKGLSRFNPGDEKGERVIRNYGSKAFPKGIVATASNRKVTRGGGTGGSRQINERLSTPKWADKLKFGRAMSEARAKGLVGDHKYSVARTGNALQEMTPERQALYHQRFKDAGIPIGNQAGNIDEVTDAVNQAKVGEETRLNKVLQQMEARGKANRKNYNGNNGENGDYTNGKVNGKKNGKLNGSVLGAASKTRTVDAVANITANAATGNYAGAAVGTGVLGMTTALQNKSTQKALGGQIGKLVSKRAGRTMMKAVPGLDIFLSGQESLDYLKQGKLDQAGIAAISGAIGWIPVIGDGASASLDLTNTGIDISRLQVPTGTSKKKGVKGTTRRTKLKV